MVAKKRRKTVRERQLEVVLESQERWIIELQDRAVKAEAALKMDSRMLQQRIALCSSLGQMIEATSKAVLFIIGKEAL